MLPLRILAIASNVLFSMYGLFDHHNAVLVLHAALFPINLYRLLQILRLLRSVRASQVGGLAVGQFLPLLRQRRLPAGATLFRAGDTADSLFYVGQGELDVVELGVVCHAGDWIGEIGVFAPDQRRTATITCRTDCVLFELSEGKAKELCFQDPAFGYALIKLIAMRYVASARLYASR
ncbi:MAG: cyclic nucleotide-binding domain-containing protein [Alphaproteobacteria bacterium]